MISTIATSSNLYFTTDGTLSREATSYVTRQADDDLYNALKQSEFCYVLTSRQMGKSSLMIRAAERLHQDQCAVVHIDLTQIGKSGVSALQFYDAIQIQLDDQLGLCGALDNFWQQSRFEPVQRFIQGLRDVVLARCSHPIVIFIDEVDSVQSLSTEFTDEFFGVIRSCFTERAHDSRWQRLTFCLLGVATPSELIKNPLMTPFNIGQRIVLNDFTLDEARLFAQGMNREAAVAQVLLQRVMYWTNGQPYLTQLLCKKIAEDPSVIHPSGVDRCCEALFFAHRARETETNLQHVRTLLLREGIDHAAILDLYRQVRRRKRVKDSETNALIKLLQLVGLVRVVDEYLEVRNQIYFRAFDEAWIEAHLPDAEKRRQRAAYRRGVLLALGMSAVVVAVMAGLTLWAVGVQREATRQEAIAIEQKNLALQAINTLTYDQIQKLLAEAPNVRRSIRNLSVSYEKLGDVQLQLGNTQQALQAYEQSLEIAKRLATADPQNAEAQRDLSTSYFKIAEIHLKENKLAEALAWYQKALAIDEKLAALDPLNQTFQQDLKIDERKIADIEARLQQKKAE